MITIVPDYAKQTASRAANKALDLTDPMRQLSSLVDVARSADADQLLAISIDQLAKIRPFVQDVMDKGGRVRYAVTTDSGMPLEASWTKAVSGCDTVELGLLDQDDRVESERVAKEKPLPADADYAAVRVRANARPGAKPVVPVLADPTNPDNWED